jgi:diadenosine tetraphosphate (Ap4A) HIT family hydrolase
VGGERSVLWAGWRQKYLTSVGSASSSGRSVFVEILESGRPDEETLIVRRGPETFALMNLHPYSSGHLMVAPNRQIAELELLTRSESIELWTMVTEAVSVLKRALRADGVNVGLNLASAAGGSVPEHLHVHVVPRWSGDVNFLGSTADTRVIPEAIDVTADRIRSTWEAMHPSV